MGTQGFPVAVSTELAFFANFGVRVFFVISGFLITHLLIEEREKTGSISLKLFYLRRLWRISPPFYVYIAAAAVLWGASTYDVMRAATYTINYHYERPWILAHLWSLAVEEQFYLLWPAAMCLAGVRTSTKIAVAALIVAPVVRLLWLESGIGGSMRADVNHFETCMDSLAVGCLLACLRDRLEVNEWYGKALRSPLLWPVVLTVFALGSVLSQRPRIMVVWASVLNIAVALMLHRLIDRPQSLAGRWMNVKPLAFIGAMSYSIYLWQQPFLNRFNPAWYAAFPQNIVLMIVVALAAHYLVERPSQRRSKQYRAKPVESGVAAAHAKVGV